MTLDEFIAASTEETARLSRALAALALDRRGEGRGSLDLASKVETDDTKRVHAYLHRKEGDRSNARYW